MARFSAAERSRIMQRVKSRHTAPERLVRSALHRMGYRFRLHRADLPGRPDIVLPKYGAVVQVRGCFWHQHACPRGDRRPASNRAYWLPKLERTKRRDARNDRRLRERGWRVIVVWTCRCETSGRFEREMRRVDALLRERSPEVSASLHPASVVS